jgi:hypothetical protein
VDSVEDFQKALAAASEEEQRAKRAAVVALWDDDQFEKIRADLIGRGSSRDVFAATDRKDAVIKRMRIPFVGANVMELFIWNAVTHTKWRGTFGEVLAISKSGKHLMMERLDDIRENDYGSAPAAPIWVHDIQPSNFGKNAAQQIKLRDYAMVRIGEALASQPPYRAAWQA